MSDEPKPVAERSYRIGDVGDGARIAQGENISWVEEVARLPEGQALAQQFEALLERISKDKAQESPAAFRRALLDAKSWFGGTVSWVGHALGGILKSEAAQKTVGTVAEAGTRAAIASFLG